MSWAGKTPSKDEWRDILEKHARWARGEAEGQRADLRDANLRGAYLQGAKNLRLPTGETWEQYLAETVPALLTAAGKSLESYKAAWECHSWDNCPMAHAFDVHTLEDVPLLLRPRAEQFVQLFDAKQIPWAAIARVKPGNMPEEAR